MTIISRDEFKNNFDYFFNNKYSKEIFINDNGNIKVLSSLKTYNSLKELASQKKIDIKSQENNDFIDVISFNQKCIKLNTFFYNISI